MNGYDGPQISWILFLFFAKDLPHSDCDAKISVLALVNCISKVFIVISCYCHYFFPSVLWGVFDHDQFVTIKVTFIVDTGRRSYPLAFKLNYYRTQNFKLIDDYNCK